VVQGGQRREGAGSAACAVDRLVIQQAGSPPNKQGAGRHMELTQQEALEVNTVMVRRGGSGSVSFQELVVFHQLQGNVRHVVPWRGWRQGSGMKGQGAVLDAGCAGRGGSGGWTRGKGKCEEGAPGVEAGAHQPELPPDLAVLPSCSALSYPEPMPGRKIALALSPA